MVNPWVSRVSCVLLFFYYFIVSVSGTWIEHLFLYFHLEWLVLFVVSHSLIILTLLLVGVLSIWISSLLWLGILGLSLFLAFYFHIIPRLVI